MYKINIAFLAFFVLLFYSCNSQVKKRAICEEKFKEARDLVYGKKNEIRQTTLDSALSLVNESLQCESIKKSVIEFKIRLLISMKKYSQGIAFVDSLKESDFTYNYKKNLMIKNLRALSYSSENDTTQRNLIYQEMANDLEQYIKNQKVKGKKFEEIFLDLYSVKEHFLNANQINNEIDSLIKVYPEQKPFFEYLRK